MYKLYPVNKKLEIHSLHSLFEAERSKEYSFPGEAHDFWECVYVEDGNICVSGDGRIYHLTKGDIIFHKPMEIHKYNVENCKAARLFIFAFSASGEAVNFFKNRVFRLEGHAKAAMCGFLEFTHGVMSESAGEKAADMWRKLDTWMMLGELCKRKDTYPDIAAAYIYMLMMLLYETDCDISPVSDLPDTVIFEAAVAFMSKNISENLLVPEIAAQCGVSLTSLKNIFGRFAGMSVHKYFIKQKIGIAMRLLRQGVSVTETAEKLGFSSQSYFTSVCKRETGLCPTELKDKEIGIREQ
ncbi:MAG: helix-turn-helix transcriptional regulator [Clostridia bacterium]|nr:helix-turn-helix transcriptional regulator [Clostridia bacterium]